MSHKRIENSSRIPCKQHNGDTEGKKDTVGIRYITEDLIRKISKQNNVEQTFSLNLKLSAEGGKKFKYIENLENCKRLQVLNLSCNVIEKLEKLDKLTKLRELDVSYNCLAKIEGLETLTSLTHLNLTGNEISSVPAWLPKKLKSLQVLKLAKNEIRSLHELTKLRNLRDLTQLTIAGNPVATLPHCRIYLVFHLRTLDTVDAQTVDWQERTEAQARFSQEELDNLQKQLDAKDAEIQKLEEAQNKSMGEIEEGVKTTSAQKERLRGMNEKIKELQQVLQTKDDLLTRKTKELTKACEKHYELEQELAFYKIDHKFEQLGKPPTANNSQEDSLGADTGLIGESPYIGRGRFHKQKMAAEASRQNQQNSFGNQENRSFGIDEETRIKMHEALDKELEDKKKSIDRAQDRLHHLSKEVKTVEDQLTLATQELRRLQNSQPNLQLTEDDKHVMRSKLAKKISKVHHLRSEADRLGSEMENAQDHIQSQERNISQIRNTLKKMGSQHQLYPEIKREMADKETQLQLTNQQYQDLVAKLEDVLATIAKETTDIQELEHQLREGQITHNEEMKEELEGIIAGLQNYLGDVQQKSAEQKEDFNELLLEREELQGQIEDLLDENDQLRVTRDHLSQLQDRMASLEESLEEAKEENRSLHHQLSESRIREMDDAEMSLHLRDAEHEILRLEQAVKEADKKLKIEKENADAKLEAERLQSRQLEGRAYEASDAEDEVHNLQQQLAQLQNVNSELQDRLYKAQQKKAKEERNLIDPTDLKQRLDDFRRAFHNGQRAEKGHPKDSLGAALDALQNDLQGELEKSHHDLEDAQEAAVKAKREVEEYRRRLEERDAELGEERRRRRKIEEMKKDRSPTSKKEKSSQIDLEKEEMERLRRELAVIRAELERGKNQIGKEAPIPTRLLEPSEMPATSVQSSAYRPSEVLSIESSSGGSEGDRQSWSSSRWSKRKDQLYEGMTPEEQDLFDELQGEMDELRRLLAKKKNKQAMDKMTQAEMTANRLMELMSDRHRQTETDSGSGRRFSNKYSQGQGPHRRKSGLPKDGYRDPRLDKTAQELEQAQAEIEDLRGRLKEKRSQLKHEVRQADETQGVIDEQQDEIDRLHTVLDDQRAEIEKLQAKMARLTSHPRDRTLDQLSAYDTELQELQDSAAVLRDTLASHGPRIHRLGNRPGANVINQPFVPMGLDEPDGQRFYHQRVHDPPPQYGLRRQHSDPTMGPQYHHPMDGHPTSQIPPHAPHALPRQPFHLPDQSSSQQQANQVPSHMPYPTHRIPSNSQPNMPIPTNHVPGENYGTMGGPTVLQAPGPYNPNLPNGPQQGHTVAQDGIPTNVLSLGGFPFQPNAQQLIATQLPTTPTKYSAVHSQPTTPIAGSVLGPSVMSLTPSHVTTVPVMVSTPQAGDVSTSLKGILKNGNEDDSEEHLTCNVPEHHDLEDYIGKLQEKIKSLKSKLKTKHATKEKRGEGYRVVFEDDMERSAIKHLHAELQARRGELESLDLAVERQKSSLRHMKETEKSLLSERETAKKELKNLRKNRTREDRRRAFLDGQGDYDVYDSDYDYDYIPSRQPFKGARVTYLQEEIACLEKTLGSRRAELREADRLLEECQEEVDMTKAQTKSTLEKYQEAKANFHQTLKDAELLESRARETGHELMQGRSQLNELMKEVAALQLLRKENQEMLKAIQEVISARDQEFQVIDRKLKEAKASLNAHENFRVQRPSSQESQKTANDTIDHQEELQEVQETLKRRQGQLDGLERQLDRELSRGKREVDELQSRSDILKAEQDQFDTLIKTKQETLQKVQDEIDREEAVLQDLATTTNKQRSDLHMLNTDIQVRETELQSVQSKLTQRLKQIDASKSRLAEEDAALKKTRQERLNVMRDLEDMKLKVSDAKEDLDRIEHQRDILEGTLETLQKDKMTLEELNKAVERKISQLQRSETKANNNIKEAENKLSHVENSVRQVECDIEGLQNERSLTHSELLSLKTEIQERKTELDMVINEVNEAENQMALIQQREAERRHLTEEKRSNLELRVQEMGNEIRKRTDEKEKLVEALSRSGDEIQGLRHNLNKDRDELEQKIRGLEGDIEVLKTQLEDRSKEVQQVREKSSQEIADLENIAQAHYSRANRLSDELNYLQAEYLEVKERVKSQQELENKEKIIQEAIEEMRADIKQELQGSLGELETSHMESLSELHRMQGRSDHLQECLHQLRHTLKMINNKNSQSTSENDEHKTSQSVEDEFAKQQNFLMAQLRDKVNKHADNFANQKQLSQDSIRSLQNKLTNLEKVFAQNDHSRGLPENQHSQELSKSLTHALDGGAMSTQELTTTTTMPGRSPSPKRAYSPNRHSQTRQRTFSGSHIPEKDISK